MRIFVVQRNIYPIYQHDTPLALHIRYIIMFNQVRNQTINNARSLGWRIHTTRCVQFIALLEFPNLFGARATCLL